jgi:hypothetical protein
MDATPNGWCTLTLMHGQLLLLLEQLQAALHQIATRQHHHQLLLLLHVSHALQLP